VRALRRIPRSWLVAILAAVSVAGYCVAVMIQVRTTPELGIRSTFTPTVGRVFPQYVRSPLAISFGDLNGSRIVEVGPHHIESCPQFLRVIRNLPSEPIEDSGGTRRRENGEELVRVMLQRPGEETQVELWMLLGHAPLESIVPSMLWMALELGMFVVGLLVFWKRPDDQAARAFLFMTLVAVGAYVGGYHWWQIVTQPVLLAIFVFCALLLPAAGLHFHHVFPSSKSWLIRHRRLTLIAIYLPAIVIGSAIMICYAKARLSFRAAEAVDVVQGVMLQLRVAVLAAFGVSALSFLAGVFCLLHSFRRAANDIERNQVKWILFGSMLALAPISYSLYLAMFSPWEVVGGGTTWPMFIASAFITAAFTVSITRHRLWRIDLLLGSGMVYFLISFLAGLVYYVLVFTGVMLVGSQVITGPSLQQALWVSSTALVLVVALDWLRSRFRRTMEQHFRRDKHQLDRTLHQLSEAIEHLVEPTTLSRHLLNLSAELFEVESGALFLGEGDPPLFQLAGTHGNPPPLTALASGCPLIDSLMTTNLITVQDVPDAAVRQQLHLLNADIALALSHNGRLLGFLLLGPKASGYYTPEDYQLISALAPIATLALQSAAGRRAFESLNRDLQAKIEKISEQQSRIRVLQQQLLRRDNPATEPEAATEPKKQESTAVVGSSIVVGQLLDLVRKVAASPSAVLLRGESGTGKELLAEAIHENSPRKGKPFVKVHCASLSPTLLESELFGHVKGAFTGAVADKIGRFEQADGGTLFLDEIGDVSLDVQTKLLRVLQEKVIERVGSGEPVRVDVRIVAATHQNLEKLIQSERFREDLYYRLNVIPITVPPLRERREDIPELALHFLREFAQSMNRGAMEIDDEAMLSIQAYAWPGNVRQLRNAIERAVVVAETPLITLADLSAEFRQVLTPPSVVSTPEPRRRVLHSGRADRLRQERDELVRALADARGNKAEAARALGIPRSTLLSRMQKHGLQ